MVALISAAVSVTDCLTGDAVGQRLVHSCDLLVRICDGGFCLLNAFVCLSQTRIESLIDRVISSVMVLFATAEIFPSTSAVMLFADASSG